MNKVLFDIETDGLTATKIHCLSYKILNDNSSIKTITKPNEIIEFFKNTQILIGHNIVRYDIPTIERLYNIKIETMCIDTLAVSWYLFPVHKLEHNLEYWGEHFKIKKVEIKNWKSGDINLYIKRCERDVEINVKLFKYHLYYIEKLYDNPTRIFNYLSFKMKCLRDQDENGITLDVPKAEKLKHTLEYEIEKAEYELSQSMPKVIDKKEPKVMYIKSGELSSHGKRWKERLKKLNLSENDTVIYKSANPGSHTQLKNWLFSIGWVPKTFKEIEDRKIPQVSLPFDRGLCPSVLELSNKYSSINHLKTLYKAKHRLGLVNSMLQHVDTNNKIYASAHGFTNTLRLQHIKPLVNLPTIDKYYGKEIRELLTVKDETYNIFGSDIRSLEDNTKQHYIYFFDNKYVKEMRVENFDPHLDIGVISGLITKEEEKFYKKFDPKTANEDDKERYNIIHNIRFKAKTVNFSATYGAGPSKLASMLKCDLEFAIELYNTYWKRNSAIKKVVNACSIKKIGNNEWVFNPVSGFWNFLKNKKDIFSTLNQGTGVYVFDKWIKYMQEPLSKYNIAVNMQYHDEILLICKKKDNNEIKKILFNSIERTNKNLKLNVPIEISVKSSNNYANCH